MQAIVVSTAFPYPLDDGYRVRLFHVLRGIARALRVTLVAPAPSDSAHLDALQDGLGERCALTMFTGYPALGARARAVALGAVTSSPLHSWSARYAGLPRALERAVSTTSRVDSSQRLVIAMSPFALPIVWNANLSADIVDFHNIYADLFRQYATRETNWAKSWYLGRTAKSTHDVEVRGATEAAESWLCSSNDEVRLAAAVPGLRSARVPNGTAVPPIARWTPSAEKHLLFFGRLDYAPNVDAIHWLANEIVPLLREASPTLCVHIAGAGGGNTLRALVESTPGMRFIGRVESVAEELHRAFAVIVPLRMGGGTRLKVLEALGAGCPVIATSTAVEGLELRKGIDYLHADSAEQFAQLVGRLMGSTELARQLSRNGYSTVRERYDWSAIEEVVAERVREILTQKMAAAASSSSA